MFFMTRKRFEEEVYKRVEDWQKQRMLERDLYEFNSRLCKVEERIARLECKGKMDGVPVEVCNAKEL